MNRIPFFLSLVSLLLLISFSCNVFAHDTVIDEDLSDMTGITLTHEDEDPWKGYVNVTVTNTGSTPWGDFHFQIMSCMGSDVSNVEIVDADPYKPTTSQTPFSYAVDNASIGSTLDYFFYSDPVTNGESATFTFYTDNTTNQVDFCLYMCPTPVPEPAMLSLFGLGLCVISLIRRRR